jgi:hypothetical protein
VIQGIASRQVGINNKELVSLPWREWMTSMVQIMAQQRDGGDAATPSIHPQEDTTTDMVYAARTVGQLMEIIFVTEAEGFTLTIQEWAGITPIFSLNCSSLRREG